ncbi:hypothetical protein V1477_008144 [Vespula maculifrons]|uniref:Uncharacterized protein n=1 Tax=Vespula maculifrons TaxID=7453 RepID=A0ABD2BVJ2_VESMC
MEMKQNIQPIMGNDYVQQKINRIISDIRMQVDLCEIIETDAEISIISRMSDERLRKRKVTTKKSNKPTNNNNL